MLSMNAVFIASIYWCLRYSDLNIRRKQREPDRGFADPCDLANRPLNLSRSNSDRSRVLQRMMIVKIPIDRLT
jgi:hypothetical protein